MQTRSQAATDPFCEMSRSFATTVNEQRHPLGYDVNGIPNPFTDPNQGSNLASVGRVALFHYVTRSLEDFKIKSLRAGGSGASKQMDFFESMKKCAPLLVKLFYMQLCRQFIFCCSFHLLGYTLVLALVRLLQGWVSVTKNVPQRESHASTTYS
jgi:hypothetical protein